MPNVATWWLGRDDISEGMIAKLDGMVIAWAFEPQLDERRASEILGAKLDTRSAKR